MLRIRITRLIFPFCNLQSTKKYEGPLVLTTGIQTKLLVSRLSSTKEKLKKDEEMELKQEGKKDLNQKYLCVCRFLTDNRSRPAACCSQKTVYI